MKREDRCLWSHGLGFYDLKTIEAAHFLRVTVGREMPIYDFERAFEIVRAVHAMAHSARKSRWVPAAEMNA